MEGYHRSVVREDLPLTDREKEYLFLTGCGMSKEDIARMTYSAVSSVRGALFWATHKLKARNITHAVVLFWNNGHNGSN